MLFKMPRYPCQFEIPDSWLEEAKFNTSTKKEDYLTYLCIENCKPFDVIDIEPPCRSIEMPKSAFGFDRERLIKIVKEIQQGEPLPPVKIRGIMYKNESHPSFLNYSSQYKFKVVDGYHRFYCSVAFGFTQIPAEMM